MRHLTKSHHWAAACRHQTRHLILAKPWRRRWQDRRRSKLRRLPVFRSLRNKCLRRLFRKHLPKQPAQEAQPKAPGPEPKLDTFLNDPRIKPLIDEARRTSGDTTLSPRFECKQGAKKLEYLEGLAKDEYTKRWTVWHEDKKVEDAFRLGEQDRKLNRAKAYGEAEDAAAKRDTDVSVWHGPGRRVSRNWIKTRPSQTWPRQSETITAPSCKPSGTA